VEVGTLLVLVFRPEVVAVTSTLTEHDAPGAKVAPLNVIVLVTLFRVTVPPFVLHPFTTLGGVAMTSPAGNMSVKLMAVNEDPPFGLVT
jgi:hypothetical protein